MIKIGVSACLLYPDPERAYFAPKTLCYLENDMAKYLTRKDVLPILIPDLAGEQMAAFLEGLDGLVLQGGVDLSPESYGEKHLDKKKWPGDKYRDDYELALMDYFFRRKKPIYAICRGAQVANVYFKGTLYQDIPTECKTETKHRNAEKYDTIKHQVDFTKGGVIEEIYGPSAGRFINSVHHQAVKKLGDNLVIEASNPDDNIIEAFRYNNMQEHYVLAVQWHPEFSPTLGDQILDPDPLYDHFLAAVEKSK